MATNQEKLDGLVKNTFSKGDGAYQNNILGGLYSKRDGAYTNSVLKDIAALIHRGHAAQGLILEGVKKLDSGLLALRGVLEAKEAGTVDAAAVAAQIVELLPERDAKEIVAELGRQLTDGSAK